MQEIKKIEVVVFHKTTLNSSPKQLIDPRDILSYSKACIDSYNNYYGTSDTEESFGVIIIDGALRLQNIDLSTGQ
jgi:hypothetical protein